MKLDDALKLSRDQIEVEALECLRQISEARHKGRLEQRAKPLLGGPFGAGGFSMCSCHFVGAGLDGVAYFVRSDSTGFVIGSSSEKVEALSLARAVLKFFDGFRLHQYMQDFAAWTERFAAEQAAEHEQRAEARRRLGAERASATIKSIPRRRKQIFDESAGKCHYCETALTLDGKWHIEHKMPRALLGGNEPGNLVASCVPCNMKKRDRTDVEFIAALAGAAK